MQYAPNRLHVHRGVETGLHSIYTVVTFPHWRISNPFQSASECDICNMLLQDVLKNVPTQLFIQDATTWMAIPGCVRGRRLDVMGPKVNGDVLPDEIIIRTQDR